MVQAKFDCKYNFLSCFNPDNGFYFRSGVLQDGIDTGIDPFMASFPELLDIGIMGTCPHGRSGNCTVQCYQSGSVIEQPDMTLEDYRLIMEQSKGKVFQVALGGRGDPNLHPNFEDILRLTREYGIVPNFTTSGFKFTSNHASICKEYCGAVAVSWYRRPYTLEAIKMLLDAGVTTNIHFVLSKSSIGEAITRLLASTRRIDDPSGFPAGINAVIFLLHKPVGLGQEDNVLSVDDPRVKEFFDLVDSSSLPFKVGFDSCSIPAIINFSKSISRVSIDTCEGARFSAYISPDMKILPCSFDQDHKWAVDLRHYSIEEAWNSERFEDFRNILRAACPSCPDNTDCSGGCPIKPQIVLCNRVCKGS